MMHARARRYAVWIALTAMLLAALAPTISRALARTSATASALLEVCTATGPRILADHALASSAAPTSGAPQTAFSLDHCPFCLPIADRLAPPPAASTHFFNADSGLAPPDAQALFFLSHLAVASLPRGPPLQF